MPLVSETVRRPMDELPRYLVQEKTRHGFWITVAVLLNEKLAQAVHDEYRNNESEYSTFDTRLIVSHGRVTV